jgi:hypothetical protein
MQLANSRTSLLSASSSSCSSSSSSMLSNIPISASHPCSTSHSDNLSVNLQTRITSSPAKTKSFVVFGSSCQQRKNSCINLQLQLLCCFWSGCWAPPGIIIIMLRNQAIASTPSAPHPSGHLLG